MSLLEKIGVTKSKGMKRLVSFVLFFAAAKYPELFSNPQIVEWLAALGFGVGQLHAMNEEK